MLLGETFFLDVSDIAQYCWAWMNQQSGVATRKYYITMQDNIIDNHVAPQKKVQIKKMWLLDPPSILLKCKKKHSKSEQNFYCFLIH